ncbi:MAG TPA: tetratricopeptide repeat protein [Opitutaceae bacterium]|nr:tetratricopeptide repeat protein [Opitutaceae bacterium]
MGRPLRTALLLAGLAAAARLAAVTYDEAQALYGARRYPEARAAFEAVAAADPGNAGAAYHLGELALMRDEPEEAVKWLEKATALAPASADYWVSMGDAYGLSAQHAGLFFKPGLARKCHAAYDRAVALDPRNVEAHASLYRFYRQAPALVGGGLDKARTEALVLQKLDDLQGTLALVEVSSAEKNYDAAFKLLQALRQRHPDSPVAAYQIGRLAAQSGQRLDEGAASLKEYLKHVPADGEPPLWAAHWRLGIIYEKKGDAAGARTEYQAGLKLNPTQPQLVEALQRVP